MLVAVLDVADDVLVAPVTADEPAQCDLWTVQVPLAGMDVVLAVWVSLETSIGWEALDVHVGDAPADILEQVHLALRRGQEPPRGLALGRGLDEPLRRRRNRLREELADFADARLWEVPEDDDEDGQPVLNAGAALTQAGYGIGDVKSLLGLSAKQARHVLDESHPLDAVQLDKVSAATSASVRNAAEVVPVGWVKALADPSLRADFDEIAQARGCDAWQLRSEQVALMPAARSSRGHDADYASLARDLIKALRRHAGLR